MSENNVNSTEEIVLSVEMGDAVSAQTAEAYAVGKRGGVDVAETDPTWHNNAKYYAEQAEEAAGEAQGAEEAAQRAETAQAAAEAARDRAEAIGAGAAQSAAAAAESAQAAATAKTGAETAQSAAAGSATAAEGSAGRASQSATAAAGSATAAGTAKTAAETARDAAAGSATAAAGSATAADQSAQAAAASAQAAEDVAESIPADYSQLSADVTGLKSAFEQLNDNVIVDSAGPAPIVSIPDGADGMPMRKVEVAIEPVQDLHGYEYPWPAGGGKNLFPPIETTTSYGVTFTQDGDYINISGTPSANASVDLFRGTLPSGTYTFNGVTGASNASYRTGLKINDDASWTYNTENQRTFTLEAESQVRFTLFVYPAYGTFNDFKVQYQLERGDTVTPWTPYSNVCPISGWTGAKVTRAGINVWDEVWELGSISGSTGVNSTSAYNIRSKNYIAVLPGETYYVYYGTESSSAIGLRLYGKDKNFLRTAQAKNSTKVIPEDTYFLRFVVTNITEYENNISINYPATDTEYHPYVGQTYEVTFPANPGTVYGGTLDVVSGKLVVDRIKLPVNDENKSGASLGWLVTSKGNRLGFPIKNTILPLIDIGNDGTDRVLCNVGKVSAGPNNANTFVPGECCLYRGSSNMFFRYITSTDITSADDAFAYLKSIGAEFVSPIPAPVEISLTPTEIKTLLGINNVWSDAGNISITYPADTKTYIDNRINSTRKLIAGIETGFTASKLYAVGDMLIIGDDLYKVTAQIASGATITVGTNVTKTTVAEQLLALVNA